MKKPFAPLLRKAKAWLAEPDLARLPELVEKSRGVTELVPESRRADWDKLLGGLELADGDEAKNIARVEGLARACRLFEPRAPRPPRDKKEKPPVVVEALSPVDRLPGLGPTARLALEEHGLRTVADLVWLPPSGWDDLRAPIALSEAIARARVSEEAGETAARVVVVANVKSGGVIPIRGRRCVRLVLADEDDPKCTMHAFWFFMAHGVLALGKPGTRVLFLGRIRCESGKTPRAAHPEVLADLPEVRVVRSRYPRLLAAETRRGPPEGSVRRAIAHALADGVTPDPVPSEIASRESMAPAGEILREVHAITGDVPRDEAKRALVERLAWAEAFTRVWERIATDRAEGRAPAPILAPAPKLNRALEHELGFAFTADQVSAIASIARDLAEERPMRRLLLGDVGTGKTAVALAAAAQCIASGKQVAILAPTSVLAEQYLDAVRPLERAAGAKVAFVAAGVPAAARRRAEEDLRSGAATVAIGTHALLGERLILPELGLVIVDEQQRLGVAQRLSLVRKGARPHLLTLSATPIPRTLMLALRGELATSLLRERPAGRPPVATELAPKSMLGDVIERVRACVGGGDRAFWVVPRIDEDDDDDGDPMASAIKRAEDLTKALAPHRIVLLHGGQSPADKRAAMRSFRSGESVVLVGTTVVEVGVDVPEATLMVVEDAQRFGLAQLHQLRGRVGRGAKPGACVLVHGEPLEGPARGRLLAMTQLSGGEDIAQADLDLRGAGDLGGTRQHGAEEELVFLEAGATYAWLERVERDAVEMLERDPALAAHPVLASLVLRMRRVIAVREEAG